MIDLAPPNLWLPPRPAIIRRADRIIQGGAPFLKAGLVPYSFFKASSAPAYATRTNTANPVEQTTSSNTYTFSSVACGSAVGTSLVAVEVFTYDGALNTALALSSVSIDGTNGTIHKQEYASGITAVSVCSGIASRATSNTSITIIVTLSKVCSACRIAVYRLNNLSSATPDATCSATTGHTAATGTSVSTTMNITAAGLTLECAIAHNVASFSSVVGASSDVDFRLFTIEACSARSDQNMGAETPRTFSATTTSTLITLSAVTWH